MLLFDVSADEWSNVVGFLSKDALTSAREIARMRGVCHGWRDLSLWKTWTKTFQIFPFDHSLPTILRPYMRHAIESGGLVAHKTCMEDLALNAPLLERVPEANGISRTRKYQIEDVLKEATIKYRTIASMEGHIALFNRRAAEQAELREARGARKRQVIELLKSLSISVSRMIHNNIKLYVSTGQGGFDAIREMVVGWKRTSDEELAIIKYTLDRMNTCRIWAESVGIMREEMYKKGNVTNYERNPVISEYLKHGVGDQETVTRACLEEKQALETRRLASFRVRRPKSN